ncbi:DNA polymerase III subunit gamma/tau, partial [Candidatus Gracilibacteria bacterium]|nr:DNA polymerase III subunit gamma/tau [Candidatus Gracilibacteria bacterium]
MEEISLYRKYRPHNFDNLVGQDHVKITLMNAFKSGHVSHAYLFTGPRGTGKTSTARLLAKALNCTNLKDGFEPCGECELCKEIGEGRLIDLIEIDAASNRGIDEVRDLKEKINFAPTRSKVKVYIIDEVHMMTKEAFNALLKTLEEPPAHAYFILATTEAHKIPETIISRCQRFDFKRITHKALMTRLGYIAQLEGIVAEDQALEAISKYVDGGLRDAIGLLEQLTLDNKLNLERVQGLLGISGLSLLENMYEALMNNKTKEALSIVNELHIQGSDFRQFSHEFIDLLRNKMLEAMTADNRRNVARAIKMIEVFQKAQLRLDADIPQLALEIAVIELTNNLEEFQT